MSRSPPPYSVCECLFKTSIQDSHSPLQYLVTGHNELFSEVLEIFFPKSVSHVPRPQTEARLMIPSNVPPGTCRACASRLTHVCVPLGPLRLLGETLLPSPGDVVFEARGERPANRGQSRMTKKRMLGSTSGAAGLCSASRCEPAVRQEGLSEGAGCFTVQV